MGMINKIVYDITNDPDSYNDVRKQYDSIFEMSMQINDKTGELLARFNELIVCYKYYIEHLDIDNRYLYFKDYYNKYIGCMYMPLITEYTELFNKRLDKNTIIKYIVQRQTLQLINQKRVQLMITNYLRMQNGF